MSISHLTRRELLKRFGALGLLGSASPFALNLAAMGNVAAATDSDYKALVCLFMFGGNDHHNTVIPYDGTSYNEYYLARRNGVGTSADALGIARLQADLIQLNQVSNSQSDGREFALPKELSELATLFNTDRKLAILANVGPLVDPLTNLADYQNAAKRKPAKLFSHNDQQSTWQALGVEGTTQGWGGRLADMLLSQNQVDKRIFTAISPAGNTVFLAGNQTQAYQVSTSGAVKINTLTTAFGSATGAATLRDIMTQTSGNLQEQVYADIVNRSTTATDTLTTALGTMLTTEPSLTLPTNLTNSNLAQQLRIVAAIASKQQTLGVKRQVFFVSLGGFDTHDNQITAQGALHANLSASIKYFYDALPALGLQDKVTLFTASDFGRTLASNGDGSDHGWGSHHFILGGAVSGGNIYGDIPHTVIGHARDAGSGRLIPQYSVEQYASRLGQWFGVSNSDLATIFPNLANQGGNSALNFI